MTDKHLVDSDTAVSSQYVTDMSDTRPPPTPEQLKNREEVKQRIQKRFDELPEEEKQKRLTQRREYAELMTPARKAAFELQRDFFYERAHHVSNIALAEYIRSDPDQRKAIGLRVREARKSAGLSTQQELAELADVNVETISRIENGAPNVGAETFSKVYSALFIMIDDPATVLLEYDRDWFLDSLDAIANTDLTESDGDVDFLEAVDVSNYTKSDVPVLGQAEATVDGLITWSDEGIMRNEVDHWISRPGDVKDSKAYGLVVRGDSMIPRYLPGETIIASPNAILKSGHYACVQLTSGARMIKQVYRQDGGWNLISTNQLYPPKFVPDTQIAAVHKIVHNSHEA